VVFRGSNDLITAPPSRTLVTAARLMFIQATLARSIGSASRGSTTHSCATRITSARCARPSQDSPRALLVEGILRSIHFVMRKA